MDQGHYNCRDYNVSPHFSSPTVTNQDRLHQHHATLHRHESWQELERRARSPAKMPFPLLRLPLELRQQILLYLLPRTKELSASNPLTRHAREFSAVQKRGKKGMILPIADAEAARQIRPGVSNVVWIRGNVHLFRLCRQIHNECAELVYGRGTFLLFLTYAGIKWRYRFLLPSGMAPSRNYEFLDLMPERYMRLLKRFVVNIDHVDAYTRMIKFNVTGGGLALGLRKQVQRLVNALKPSQSPVLTEKANEYDSTPALDKRYLGSLRIRISNSNAVSDALDRQRNPSEPIVAEHLATMLEPFRLLYGVREVSITGAVTEEIARDLESNLRAAAPTVDVDTVRSLDDVGGLAMSMTTALCVYGNDI